MSEEREQTGSSRSWRTIRQDVTAQAMSKRGRRRQQLAVLKIIALVTLIGGSTWGIYAIVHAWESNRAALATAVKSEPVREIVLLTDGVLTREWAAATLQLPARVSLMALDLGALRTKLMAHGQVRVAVLSRSFPDTLIITLQERTPVARVQVADGSGTPRQMFVAKDGVVYEGANYEKTLVAGLPWLAGFSLRRATDGGYEPIAGMDRVAELLTTAQLQAPHLYREWLFVSLARLAQHHELVVKSQDIPEITFSTRDDFLRQIAQLDYIIEATRQQLTEPALQSVNLALGPQVPVKLALSPDELARQQRSAPRAVEFSLPSTSSRKTNRDL